MSEKVVAPYEKLSLILSSKSNCQFSVIVDYFCFSLNWINKETYAT